MRFPTLSTFFFALALLIASLLVPESTLAQSALAQEARVLTIQEAVALARENNHDVRQADADLERAALALSEARRARLPEISGAGQYTNNLRRPVILLPPDSPFGEDALRTGSRHTINSNLQLSVPIYNPRIDRTTALSRSARDLETRLRDATAREVEIEVQRAYLNGLLARESLEVLQESEERLRENRTLVASLYKEGVAPEFDLLRTDVQISSVQPELARATNTYDGALNYLKLLTGLPINEDIALGATLEGVYEALPELDVAPTFEQNRALLQVQGREELADRQVDLARSAYLPSLSGVGTVTYQSQGDNLALYDYNWINSSTVGLSLSIPIFSGGRGRALEQARVERRQANMQREFVLESLESEYQTTRGRIEEIEATISAQEQSVAQAERGYDMALVSYEEGAYNLIEVNDAEQALTDARLSYTTALSDLIGAMLDMNELVGRPMEITAFE